MKSFKKRILSGVMAVATLASMASALNVSATCISGTNLNARVLSETDQKVTIDWDDFTKNNCSKTAKSGFTRAEYIVEVVDITPTTNGKDPKSETVTTSSQFTAYNLKAGHTYQFAISTLYYYKYNNKTKSGYGGTNLCTVTKDSVAAHSYMEVSCHWDKLNCEYVTSIQLNTPSNCYADACIYLSSDISRFYPEPIHVPPTGVLSINHHGIFSIRSEKAIVGDIGYAKITCKDGSSKIARLVVK